MQTLPDELDDLQCSESLPEAEAWDPTATAPLREAAEPNSSRAEQPFVEGCLGQRQAHPSTAQELLFLGNVQHQPSLQQCLLSGQGDEPAVGLPLLGTVVLGRPIRGRKRGAPSKPRGRKVKPKEPKQAAQGEAERTAGSFLTLSALS